MSSSELGASSDDDWQSDNTDIEDGRPTRKKVKCVRQSSPRPLTSSWSEKDKNKLLTALREHGPDNFKLLAKYIPPKTEEQIKVYIAKLEKRAKMAINKETKNRQAPLENWLNLFAKHSFHEDLKMIPISRALKYIALFEKRTESSSNVILEDCYKVISSLLRGSAPQHLNPESSMFLLNNLRKLALHIKGSPHNAEDMLLKSKWRFMGNVSSYGSKHQKSDDVSVQKDIAFNPLGVQDNLLLTSEPAV